jgi:hypothetical protein
MQSINKINQNIKVLHYLMDIFLTSRVLKSVLIIRNVILFLNLHRKITLFYLNT